MVTFNCEVCNATVPKKNTEKHYYRCPDAYYTCIDCSKTFEDGISYKQHTQCLTEDEKYQGALYRGPKAGKQTDKPDMKSGKDNSGTARISGHLNKMGKAPKDGHKDKKASSKKTNSGEKTSKNGKSDSDKPFKSGVSKKTEKTKDTLASLRAELHSGESLYCICRSIDKSLKKELLKHLVVDEQGTVTLK